MRYISINKLSDFEFHDALLSNCTLFENCLSSDINFLNIHQDTKENHFDVDMEIDTALITFDGFSLISYETTDKMQHTLYENDAIFKFTEQIKNEVTILDLGCLQGDIHYIDALANSLFFTIRFTFEKVTIKWDNYKKASWYTNK